jgi:uncharacterized oxidoreductase
LGTNPIALAAPYRERPLVLDMTTSAVAEGKLRVAFQKGENVPEGWIIDCQGRPTINPADYYATPPGALLPLGGALGFKGFGLAAMLDVFCGILSGSGVARDDLPKGCNGVWMVVLDIDHLLPREEYARWIEKYVEYIKSAARVPGCGEILMPGEVELARQADRRRTGIPVAEGTWKLIGELAARLGVSVEG